MITTPLTSAPDDLRWSVDGRGTPAYTVQRTTGLLDLHNSTLARSLPMTGNALNRAIVIVDPGFDARWGLDIRRYFEKWSVRTEFVVLRIGDGRTTTQAAIALAVRLGELRVDRLREPLMAIGGRFALDVVDLAATIFRPGAPFVRVPTTPFAQVDSGVHTGVGVGRDAFRAPTQVLVDTAFLTTLARRDLADGLAQVLGLATLRDRDLFELLEVNGRMLLDGQLQGRRGDELVSRAIGVVLAERDADTRLALGRAIEVALPGDWRGGQTATISIVVASWIAQRRGLLDTRDLHRVIATVWGLELPTWDPQIDPDVVVSALRGMVVPRLGAQPLAIPVRIGDVTLIDDITPVELVAACAAAEGC